MTKPPEHKMSNNTKCPAAINSNKKERRKGRNTKKETKKIRGRNKKMWATKRHFSSCIALMTSNGMKVVNDELERMWKEAVVTTEKMRIAGHRAKFNVWSKHSKASSTAEHCNHTAKLRILKFHKFYSVL